VPPWQLSRATTMPQANWHNFPFCPSARTLHCAEQKLDLRHFMVARITTAAFQGIEALLP
jgi:hypothetical protein